LRAGLPDCKTTTQGLSTTQMVGETECHVWRGPETAGLERRALTSGWMGHMGLEWLGVLDPSAKFD
jgi:hypothetical protein